MNVQQLKIGKSTTFLFRAYYKGILVCGTKGKTTACCIETAVRWINNDYYCYPEKDYGSYSIVGFVPMTLTEIFCEEETARFTTAIWQKADQSNIMKSLAKYAC